MRIAFLCKRRYMRHDVIMDRYARLYELPRGLAERGHDVLGICLDYRRSPASDTTHDAGKGALRWRSWSLGRLVAPGYWRYRREVLSQLEQFSPDVIIGASDCLHIVLAREFGRRLGVPYAVDLYDNFESFGMARIPGLGRAYRRAVREAALVTCVSQPLQQMVRDRYAASGRVEVLESTIKAGDFKVRDRDACRRKLGLPTDAILIGTAGALTRDRGIDRLYRAFRSVSQVEPTVHLVLAGAAEPESPIPSGANVHYLGQLPHDRVGLLYSALDVGVICILDTPFGRYSFPQKAYELAAARIPLVVASVGAMRSVFSQWPLSLYDPANPDDLAAKILTQIRTPTVPFIDIPDWSDHARGLEGMLHGVVGLTGSGRITPQPIEDRG